MYDVCTSTRRDLTAPIELSSVPYRTVTEQYFGKKMDDFVPMPKWEYKDYLGWDEQGDGKLFYGIFIQVWQA